MCDIKHDHITIPTATTYNSSVIIPYHTGKKGKLKRERPGVYSIPFSRKRKAESKLYLHYYYLSRRDVSKDKSCRSQ